MTSGAVSSSFLDHFLRVKGSSRVSAASSSSSTSSDGGRDGATAALGAADFLEEVVTPSETLAWTLGYFGPDFYPRSWSESSSMRTLIHP